MNKANLCPACKVVKIKSNRWYCNPCSATRTIAWLKAHPERARAIQLKTLRTLRLKALARLGNVCVRCGETDWRCLQIDHIDGGGSKEKRAIGPAGIRRKVCKSTKGYQLLCANCNCKKEYERDETSKPVID